MAINIRTKGQTGEREVCDMINKIYAEIYAELNIPLPEKPIAQRNQNQSAVGGCDISNTCDFAIEVKRQETLAIDTWWKQCVKSANELNKIPVLLYRQSRKKWKAVIYVYPFLNKANQCRGEISIEDFLKIFKRHATEYYTYHGKFD